MMVTDAGMFTIDDLVHEVGDRLRRLFTRQTPRIEPPIDLAPFVAAAPEPAAGPMLAEAGAAAEPSDRQRARVAAVRALLQARDGRWDEAERFFREAADIDPELPLSSVPTFWNLPRLGQEAAVRALRKSGRGREASLLAAEIGYRNRPQLVHHRPERVAS